MGLSARSQGGHDIHPQPEVAGASKAQPAGPGVGKWRLTFFFVLIALLATTVAIMVVNRIAGDREAMETRAFELTEPEVGS